jgi:hypothetical protein
MEVQAAMTKATALAAASKLMRFTDIERIIMWLLLLEAGMALFLLVFIVWWTMFSGKRPDDPTDRQPPQADDEQPR